MNSRLFKLTLFASISGCIALISPLATAQAPNALIVGTETGKVQGFLTADSKVTTFEGIPYAAPPVGDLRWQPPQPALKWEGVRSATSFGSHCPQPAIYGDMDFRDPGGSEDCLNLNVWTPAGAKPGSLPVMVWIHGGGYVAGGSSEPRQDGQFLAHRNVVIVSMNYRLGIFGFFVHPELTAESPHHASGNYGLMDEAAAIDWVKRNIKAFGGDPSNITIFGESAGSYAVSSLMASPLSKGLFAKAIGESGGAFNSALIPYQPREVREKMDSDFAQKEFGTTKLSELRKLPMEQVLKASATIITSDQLNFGPDVDGYFLPESVPAIYAAGKQAHVPLLAGWNADEARSTVLHAKPQPDAASFTAQAQRDFGAKAKDFLAVYSAKTDADALQSAGDFANDTFIVYSTWAWMEAHTQTGRAPVYRYRFDLGAPNGAGAFHSDDIVYVFGALDARANTVWREEDRKLSDQIGAYWTNFARTGDPNGPGLPKWPAYKAKKWQVMHLDATSEARPDDQRARYLFLDQVWGHPTK